MADKEESKQKTKRSTAQKRDLQNIKKREANRQFKSQVKTSIRRFEEALSKKENTTESLKAVYSLMDKGVQNGVFKLNKASRTKSRLTAKAARGV